MRALLVGYGRMGQAIKKILADEVVGIVSLEEGYKSIFDVKEEFDIIIDFSNHNFIYDLEKYLENNPKCVLIGTTSYTDDELKIINKLALNNPILFSSNYSLGVNLMNYLVKIATPILKDNFDIEIVEAHHNKKKDAPSGTALMFYNTIKDETGYKANYDNNKEREKDEVGISSIRGGNVAGTHEVMYLGEDEILTIKHEATNRTIFAQGAVLGAKWLVNQQPGLYNMNDVLNLK